MQLAESEAIATNCKKVLLKAVEAGEGTGSRGGAPGGGAGGEAPAGGARGGGAPPQSKTTVEYCFENN